VALAEVDAHRRSVYVIARRACDEIEAIAPWQDLYAPPRDPVAAARLAAAVYSWSNALRVRIDEGIAALEAAACDPNFVEYVSFYLGAVATMLRPDTLRLGTAIETARRPEATQLDAGIACEIAADVKGKGTSSLMGAAASLVAEGTWDPVATEPLLFPEKNDEFRRNHELLAAVLDVSSTLHRIRAGALIPQLSHSWAHGALPDRWALTDLGLLVAQVSQLLRPERRRALYAGDFHQLERRLRLLSARVGEVERLHAALVDDIAEASARRQLGVLLREIAALIDSSVLSDLLPEGGLARLRSLLELSKQLDGHVDVAAAAQRGALGPDATALLALLVDDDLNTFVGLLAANVARRVSFQLESQNEGFATDAVTASAASTPARPLPDQPSGELSSRLRALVNRLTADAYPGARQFRMVHKLLTSQNRVPEALLAGCRPYIHDLVDEIVPALEPMVEAGELPATMRHDFVTDALALATGSARDHEAGKSLRRLMRTLETLQQIGTEQR
jgi:hypothetical protein